MGKETTSPNEAYATFPKWQPGRKGPWPIPDWSARRPVQRRARRPPAGRGRSAPPGRSSRGRRRPGSPAT